MGEGKTSQVMEWGATIFILLIYKFRQYNWNFLSTLNIFRVFSFTSDFIYIKPRPRKEQTFMLCKFTGPLFRQSLVVLGHLLGLYHLGGLRKIVIATNIEGINLAI